MSDGDGGVDDGSPGDREEHLDAAGADSDDGSAEADADGTVTANAGGADGDDGAEDLDETCPECGEPLPAEARFCPHCASALDEDGDAVDLSELDGDFMPDELAELLVEDELGHRRASGAVRVIAGLAVSIPLAPLVLFLTGSVVSLSVWSAVLVFLAGWFLPAALLSRARVPAEAFGRSLYLIAVCTLLVPLAVRYGEIGSSGAPDQVSFEAVATASFVIAGVAVVLGAFVNRQARRRITGENRAFEDSRVE